MSFTELPTAFIQLQGEPYQRVFDEQKIDASRTLDHLARDSGYVSEVLDRVRAVERRLTPLLVESGYYTLDHKIKHGETLTFDEAFSLVAFVATSLNRPLNSVLGPRIRMLGDHDTHIKQSIALLSAMSAKEAYVGLSAEEIAGFVAATISLDTVARVPHDGPLIAFGGMGGDRGYPLSNNKTKLFSLSTLAACGLALDGDVHKHHSYPNTSKISGQSAIESFGARSDFHSIESMKRVLYLTQLLMTSCHDTRTLHTISHQLRGETINHVIGPLAFTMDSQTPLHAFIGVNEKIHPETVVRSLAILSQRGFQLYANSVVFAGTDLTAVSSDMLIPEMYTLSAKNKRHVVLDEVAPPPYVTLASFLKDGESMGTYALHAEDFYSDLELAMFSFDDLIIPNEPKRIIESNYGALTGSDIAKAKYLAMTMGLALFTKHYLQHDDALNSKTRRVNRVYLQRCTQLAFEMLISGRAVGKLGEYVRATQLYCGTNDRRRVAL